MHGSPFNSVMMSRNSTSPFFTDSKAGLLTFTPITSSYTKKINKEFVFSKVSMLT